MTAAQKEEGEKNAFSEIFDQPCSFTERCHKRDVAFVSALEAIAEVLSPARVGAETKKGFSELTDQKAGKLLKQILASASSREIGVAIKALCTSCLSRDK